MLKLRNKEGRKKGRREWKGKEGMEKGPCLCVVLSLADVRLFGVRSSCRGASRFLIVVFTVRQNAHSQYIQYTTNHPNQVCHHQP